MLCGAKLPLRQVHRSNGTTCGGAPAATVYNLGPLASALIPSADDMQPGS